MLLQMHQKIRPHRAICRQVLRRGYSREGFLQSCVRPIGIGPRNKIKIRMGGRLLGVEGRHDKLDIIRPD